MNGNRNVRANDGFADIYNTPMEERPVYAVTCSSFDQLTDDENGYRQRWTIYHEIEQFTLAWGRHNSTLAEAMMMYMNNLLRYVVRMNEYLSNNFYTGLRLPNDLINRLVGDEKLRECLRVPIKSKSILAFAKSIGHNSPYERRVPILQQLKVESKIVEDMSLLRSKLEHIRAETIRYGVGDEYGRGRLWGLACDAVSPTGSPYAAHMHMLKSRGLLSNLPRTYLVGVANL